MSAQWQSLVSQKLFLAGRLATLAGEQESPGDAEASLQGAIELALRGRQLILALIARYYQDKKAMPESIAALAEITGGCAEIEWLEALASTPGSWWNHLDQLEATQSEPPQQRKTVSNDNIIAVSAAPGPDRSARTLQQSLAAMKTFLAELGERHAEW
ncbi:hypothetical protein SAMN05216203_0954 [Marinobacter daqiaonensis]|uniref:PasA protein n=1 Tax=Marinobacter daqiaonensis TaxID=650891 RepID=A0A1I6H7I2_9GAMM|nr:DUF6586 family protein [Marinobacter daqiaonensis]SFR50274.1 hypothetical protein SAMN05216203_0954 [Marinobacter daqiaonensis]